MVTLVLGASENPERYSFKAVERLLSQGYPVVAVGRREGSLLGIPIQTELPKKGEIHTLSLYLSPKNQIHWEEAVLELEPQRLIFNPGTENPAFAKRLEAQGVNTLQACTLVLLATDQYES